MAKRKNKGARDDAGADSAVDAESNADTESTTADQPVDWDRIGREDEDDDDDDDEGARLLEEGELIGSPGSHSPSSFRSRRILGAIMSVTVPGTGHLAIDRPVRGLLWFCAAVGVMLLFGISLKLFVIGVAVTFIGAALDVGFSRPGPRQREWILICLVWFAGFMVFGQIRGRIERGWATGFTLPSAAMSPNILFGEWVVAYRRDKGGPGHAVAFKSPCPPNTRSASRIVAAAGDSVEVRCGRVYVNDQPIAREPVPGACEYKHPLIKEQRFEKRSCQLFTESLGSNSYRVLEQPERFADPLARDFPVSNADGAFTSPACQGKEKRDVTAASLARGTFKRRSGQFASDDTCALRAAYVVPKGHVFLINDNRADASDSRSWGPVSVESVIGKLTQVGWSEDEDSINWGRLGTRIR